MAAVNTVQAISSGTDAELCLWCSQTAGDACLHVNWLSPARLRVQKILLTDSASLFTATWHCLLVFLFFNGFLYRNMADKDNVFEHRCIEIHRRHFWTPVCLSEGVVLQSACAECGANGVLHITLAVKLKLSHIFNVCGACFQINECHLYKKWREWEKTDARFSSSWMWDNVSLRHSSEGNLI